MRTLLALVLLLATPVVGAKDKAAMPTAVKNATYVFVTTYYGDFFSREISTDDRNAVSNVQQAIQKWGHYKIVYNQGEADLILVVRTGHAGEVRVGIQMGMDRPRDSAKSGGAEELSDPQDALAIYLASQGISGSPMWRSRATSGLKAPEMRLVNEFRSKVEAAGKKP